MPPVQVTPATLSYGPPPITRSWGATIVNGAATFNAKSATSVLNTIGDPTRHNSSGVTFSGTGPVVKSGTGTMNINVQATYLGDTSITAGTLTISPLGSLAGTGNIYVSAGARLNISKPAGNSPATASVSPSSVVLGGGILGIEADVSVANLLSPSFTSGILSLETGATMTLGGTNTLDLSTLPLGTDLRIGGAGPLAGNGTTTLASTVSIIPDATHTLHFGGTRGTLVLANVITDFNSIPTNVEISTGLQTLVLTGNSTYTGVTTIGANVSVNINSPNALGSSATGTIINGGTVSTLTGVSLAEPFTINNGIFTLNGPSTGAIAVNGGTVSINQTATSPITISGGATAISGASSAPITQSAGILTLNAASSGSITQSGGTLTFNDSSNTSPASTLRRCRQHQRQRQPIHNAHRRHSQSHRTRTWIHHPIARRTAQTLRHRIARQQFPFFQWRTTQPHIQSRNWPVAQRRIQWRATDLGCSHFLHEWLKQRL